MSKTKEFKINKVKAPTKRRNFVKYIEFFDFKPIRINGSHEIFKSSKYKFDFSIPTGKSVKKGLWWNFKNLIKDPKQKI